MGVSRRKLIELDALRGIAACIVFSGHYCEGLMPAVTASLRGTLVFAVLNGPGAVIVFFVLSGFVLVLRPLRAGSWRPCVLLAAKRWPRLAAPVAIAGLAYSAAAFAGAFPGPQSLRVGPQIDPPGYLFWGQAQHNEQVGDVLREALVDTFARESARHNGVLWTMHWEFLGSFLVFGSAAIMLSKQPRGVRAAALAIVWAGAAAFSPWLIAFPVGVLGAAAHRAFGARVRLGPWQAAGLLLAGTVLMSWDIRSPAGIWAWTDRLTPSLRLPAWVVAESVAACLWMAVALYQPGVRRLLSGRLGSLAGRMSFAFYLIHLLVLCSVGAWLYILIGPSGRGAWFVVGLFCISATASFALAWPLMIFDQWWIGILERASRVVARSWWRQDRAALATTSGR